jgi:hypothetical protein
VEIALLRQQLIAIHRQVQRPLLTQHDRFRLVLLARYTRFLKQTLHIVQADPLLRWNRKKKATLFQLNLGDFREKNEWELLGLRLYGRL